MSQKIKLKGCNCKTCRLVRKSNRKMDKVVTKIANRAIRYENKKMCSIEEHVFDVKSKKISYYFA